MHTTTKLIPAVLFAAVVLLGGCGGTDQAGDDDAQGPEGRTVRVETLELRPTRFEDVIEVTGSVGAIDDAILSARANDRSRTDDLRFTRALLYQLSYIGTTIKSKILNLAVFP